MGAVLWGLKEAGLPLLGEFVNGDIKTRLLIATIIFVLVQMKMK